MTTGRRLSCVILTISLTIACDTITDPGPDVGAFLTLASGVSLPTAFFDGTVTKDASGCYRTSDPVPSTVIWPRGAYVEAEGSRLIVHEATGRPAGEVPGPFSFVGHRVSNLDGQPMSAETRQLAVQRCSGAYFIVEDIIER